MRGAAGESALNGDMLCRDFDKFYKWATVIKQVDMCLVCMPCQDWSPALPFIHGCWTTL